MSGRKYTTISTNKLHELEEAERKLRSLSPDLSDQIRNGVRQLERDLNSRLDPVIRRQQEYPNTLRNVSAEVSRVEREAAARIQNQAIQAQQKQAELQKAFESELAKSKREQNQKSAETEERINQKITAIDKQIVEQGKAFSRELQKEKQARENSMSEIKQEISQIQSDNKRFQILAEERIRDARIIKDFIESKYPHERFKPRKLRELEAKISSSVNVLSTGAAQSALATATDVVHDLAVLRVELEEMEAEWRYWRNQALTMTESILEEVRKNNKVKDIESSSEISQADYWVEGQLSRLEQELQAILGSLSEDTTDISLQELQTLVEERLPEKQAELDSTLKNVNSRIVRSQLRAETFETIARELEATGFGSPEFTYEGEDMRRCAVGILTNINNDKIVVTVNPNGEVEEIIVDSILTSSHAPQERRALMRNIIGILRASGLEVGDPTTISEEPSLENSDITKVRERKPISGQKPSPLPKTDEVGGSKVAVP